MNNVFHAKKDNHVASHPSLDPSRGDPVNAARPPENVNEKNMLKDEIKPKAAVGVCE